MNSNFIIFNASDGKHYNANTQREAFLICDDIENWGGIAVLYRKIYEDGKVIPDGRKK